LSPQSLPPNEEGFFFEVYQCLIPVFTAMVSISSVNDVLVVAAMIRDLCIFLNRILFAYLIGPLWIVMPLSARIVDGFPGEMAKNTFAFWKNPVMIAYYGIMVA